MRRSIVDINSYINHWLSVDITYNIIIVSMFNSFNHHGLQSANGILYSSEINDKIASKIYDESEVFDNFIIKVKAIV